MMRTIQLTKGFVAQVDDADFDRVNQFKAVELFGEFAHLNFEVILAR